MTLEFLLRSVIYLCGMTFPSLLATMAFNLSGFKILFRSSHQRWSIIKGVLRNFAKFTGKHLCKSLFLLQPQACNFIKKETLAQVFSCEFCEISKNTFFTEHLQTTAPD